jgi:hypothetical protein
MGREHIEWVFDDAKATIIQRGEERDQSDGERTIPRCVTAFNAITGHTLSNEDGWLFMEVLKKCRSVQGKYKYDDFRDGLGYAALRAEEARMTEEKRLKNLKPDEEQLEIRPAPGAVVEICKHKRSNCYECGLHNADGVDVHMTDSGVFVPRECDNRGCA